MPTQLSAEQWQRIAHLWRELGEISNRDVEKMRKRACKELMELFDASHVFMVVQRRIAPSSMPLGGFRPVLSRHLGPGLDERRQITDEWIRTEPALDQDPVLTRLHQGVGELRTVRHRADLSAEEWESAPVRRLLDRLGIEDRVNGVIPLGADVEVSFCLDRPRGAPIFDDEDNLLFLKVLEGLRPLAANFVRSYGLMPGQRSLDSLEQRVLRFLLRDVAEPELAEMLGLPEERLRSIADEVYRKLGVDDRIGLMNMWLSGASSDQSLPPELREREAALLMQSTTERVRRALQSLEPTDFEIEIVASRLGMSVRGLQRELGDEDVSFRDLADAARREHAEELLARQSLSFTEIAFRLGYEQVSSLNRSVRRWTGKTPSQFREELTDAD